jgi:hypothetical protein
VSIALSNGATMQQVTDAAGGFRFEVEVLGTVDLRVRAAAFKTCGCPRRSPTAT